MTLTLVAPPKVKAGDRVAVVSPSFAAPAVWPEKHSLSMDRLASEFGLVPVEYPSTRVASTPVERARDLTEAFGDRSIRAVLATIGGDDQITVLPHLDPAVVRADPKPFVGFSDNTNLLNWLWFHGVAAYHGGSTIMHLGRGGGLHPLSVASLRTALFDTGAVELRPVEQFSDHGVDWSAPGSLAQSPPLLPSEGWTWHRPERVVTGPTWGGNLEILSWVCASNRFVRPVADYAGCVLLVETSEEMPSGTEVFRILRNLGERGLLKQFPAAVVATAMAARHDLVVPLDERARYRAEQRAAVLRAFADYNPDAMIVFGLDFGHTDPQYVLPYGGLMTIDGPSGRVVAHY